MQETRELVNELFKEALSLKRGISLSTILQEFERGIQAEKTEQLEEISKEKGLRITSLRYYLLDPDYVDLMNERLIRGANVARDYIYFREQQNL
jgi:hypothetical protein